jgi:hypothetical protein
VSQLPKSCSLAPSEGAARAAELRELARRALRTRERDDARVLLRYRAEEGVAAAVEDLARRERECCPFLDISVSVDDGEVTLAIEAAPEDRAALDAFYELAET